jgi:hypothetical protein
MPMGAVKHAARARLAAIAASLGIRLVRRAKAALATVSPPAFPYPLLIVRTYVAWR